MIRFAGKRNERGATDGKTQPSTQKSAKAAFYRARDVQSPMLLIDETATVGQRRALFHILRTGTTRDDIGVRQNHSYRTYRSTVVTWTELPAGSPDVPIREFPEMSDCTLGPGIGTKLSRFQFAATQNCARACSNAWSASKNSTAKHCHPVKRPLWKHSSSAFTRMGRKGAGSSAN